MIDAVSIDRLVLDVPGLAPGDAEELARQIGAGLAARAAAGGNFDALSVTLDGDMQANDIPRLARMILQSLLQSLTGQVG